MYTTEVKNREKDLATDLVMMGVFRVGESVSPRLLPPPEEESSGRLTFDPVKESNYLMRFPDGLTRRHQLETEISTALSELLLSEYSHDYRWEGERIVDGATGITVESLAKNSELESQRLGTVEERLKEGADLAVSVSRKNEKLDYPDDMVDFWKRGEGDKLTLLRFKVEMGERELADFESMDKSGYKLSDLIRMLSLAKSSDGLSVEKIGEITRGLVKRFENEFGKRIFMDADLITRVFISTRLEVEKQKGKNLSDTGTAWQSEMLRIQDYLYGELKTKIVAGGGCGGSSLGGEFGSGRGIIIMVTADGISFVNGSTEGLTFCPICGCWYSGPRCPLCSKGNN